MHKTCKVYYVDFKAKQVINTKTHQINTEICPKCGASLMRPQSWSRQLCTNVNCTYSKKRGT